MKRLHTYITEKHKWDNDNDENILNFIVKLYSVVKQDIGSFGLQQIYLKAIGFHGSHGEVITWGHKETPSSFYKKGLSWEEDYKMKIEFPDRIANDYFDKQCEFTFDELSENYDEIIKKFDNVKNKKIDYKLISDVLYALSDAVHDTSAVYIRALGYHGSHGDVVEWLSHGVSSCIDEIKYWGRDHTINITVDSFLNTKMFNYLKKNYDFLTFNSNGDLILTIDDCIQYHDELIDALS